MKVCIGITTFNRCAQLAETLEHALAQDYIDRVIFVVDDASTDATEQLRANFPQVRWQRFDRNVGYRNARNYLMQNADADLYISLDDDSWFLSPDSLSTTVRIFAEHPQLAALGFNILYSTTTRTADNSGLELSKARSFVGCGHALRLSCVREVGYYSSLPMSYGAEEVDLCLRLLDAGYEVMRAGGVHVYHDKSLVERDVATQHAQAVCNTLSVALARYPLGYLIVMLPVQLGRKLASGAFFALKADERRPSFELDLIRERGRYFLLFSGAKGILRFARALPAVIRERRPVSYRTFHDFVGRRR